MNKTYSKQYLVESLNAEASANLRNAECVWYLLNVQEDGWEIIRLVAEEVQIDPTTGKINSQRPQYKALRTLVQNASQLVAKGDSLVKDENQTKLTIGRVKDSRTGKLSDENEIRESGASRGRNSGKGKAGEKDGVSADLMNEEKLATPLPVLEALCDKFGYDNVIAMLDNLAGKYRMPKAA